MSGGRRVVSLLPSVTETLRAWQLDPVACTRFCERPDLPHVGGTKDPDVAAIIALEPDVVVLDEEENRSEDADALAAAGVHLLVTAVRSLADVGPTLDRLAAAVGFSAHENRERRASAWRPPGSAGTAFVPIWRRPWMTLNGDTYGSSLLAEIGIENVYAAESDRYPTVELGDVVGRRPDRVLAPSEPYPFAERNRGELETVAPMTLVDGRDLFWWGIRTPSALNDLAVALA